MFPPRVPRTARRAPVVSGACRLVLLAAEFFARGLEEGADEADGEQTPRGEPAFGAGPPAERVPGVTEGRRAADDGCHDCEQRDEGAGAGGPEALVGEAQDETGDGGQGRRADGGGDAAGGVAAVVVQPAVPKKRSGSGRACRAGRRPARHARPTPYVRSGGPAGAAGPAGP